MFDTGLLAEPNADNQRKKIGEVVQDLILTGKFNYTELLCEREPFRSFAFEYLDGVKVQGNIPVYMSGDIQPQTWNGEPIRLVHISPSGQISHGVREAIKVPGTNQVRFEKVRRTIGNVADVPDAMPDRVARNILFQQGWPVRQHGGGPEGSVIEWRWLLKAKSEPNPAFRVVDIYDEIAARVYAHDQAFANAALAKAEANMAAANKNKPASKPAQATP